MGDNIGLIAGNSRLLEEKRYRYVWNNERGGYSNRLQPSPNEEWSRPVSSGDIWLMAAGYIPVEDARLRLKIYTRNAQSRWWIDTGHK
jgi:hypothetical protein